MKVNRKSGGTMSHSKTIIKIQNLNKTYRNKTNCVTALDGINLEIKEGEIFGIIGLSGAGKSTLVRCINYLEKPTAGSVIVDGSDLGLMSQKQLNEARQSIGMIFQQFNLMMQRNVLKNVCFPLEIAGTPQKIAKQKAFELLEMVGLKEKAYAYPAQLSGGQKQRVAIARAIANDPKVLLCDEATSALDPTTTKSILSLLKQINKDLGITIVVITHEMDVIEEICDKVAIVDKSRIAEVGDVSEIFENPKTAIAQKLILPGKAALCTFDSCPSNKKYRIIFDGNSAFEPIISGLVLNCQAPVNILHADTRTIEGKAIGQMIVQLPNENGLANKMLEFLDEHHIAYEEVTNHV